LDNLEKEVQKNSNDSLINKTATEEKTNDFQKKIQSDNAGDRLANLENFSISILSTVVKTIII